jgi:amino acid transporter
MNSARPALFHWDVVGFTMLAVVAIRLVPIAAASGPSVVLLWILAALAFFAPVAITTVILTRDYPGTGGIYTWSKIAFGDLHGFIAAWTYWSSALVFFPSVLIFSSSQSAFILPGSQHLAENQTYLTCVSIASVLLLLVLNLGGMRFATYFHNISAATKLVIVTLVVALATAGWIQLGPASDFHLEAWVPKWGGLKDFLFFSSIVYMLSGAECASQLGDEVHESHRTIPRALLYSGLVITAIYIVCSLALLVSVPSGELSGLKGFAAAVSTSARRLAGDSFAQWATSVISLLLVVTHLGTVSVWLAATARLPFVIGLDRYLPEAFGRRHHRYGSPYVALISLAIATIALVILSSLGGAAEQVYHTLISIEIAIYFIPYLYLFAALIKLKAGELARNDGQQARSIWWSCGVSAVGFVVTATSLILALIPGEQIENPAKFYAAVFGSLALNLAVGTGLYLWGRQTRRQPALAAESV